MKRINTLAALAALLAMSVTAVNAADETRVTSSVTTRSDKTLGHVERASKLIGNSVFTSDNQKVGKIENFVVDMESGRVLYAVVGTGPLGIGHDYAVAPGAFTAVRADTARLNIDKAKLTAAPEFTKDIDKPEQLSQATFVNQVYQYYGQPAWWQGSAATDAGSFHNVHKAKDIIGMNIKNVNNDGLGEIQDLMVDLPAGRVVYVVFDPDRSLNLGNNYYAMPPNAFTLGSDRKHLVSDLAKEKLAAAPHFPQDQWPNLSDPAYGTRVYQHYGKDAYFESSRSLSPTGRQQQNYKKN